MPATVHKPGALTKARRREKAAAHARPARTAAARKKAAAKNLIEEFKVSESQDTRGKRVGGGKSSDAIAYRSTKGVDDYVRRVARATPMEIVEIERQGVLGSFIKDLSKRMEIPSSRFFTILGVPKATAEKKAAAGERVAGRGGQATIGMVKLLNIAQEIVANSTASEARGFDAAKWLGQWIERQQPALGGRKPADLLDTPTGVEVVARLLGAIESGAYQ
jgi:putative toxin-antitoxin system antitoxin component (TIGR02293 family)